MTFVVRHAAVETAEFGEVESPARWFGWMRATSVTWFARDVLRLSTFHDVRSPKPLLIASRLLSFACGEFVDVVGWWP